MLIINKFTKVNFYHRYPEVQLHFVCIFFDLLIKNAQSGQMWALLNWIFL
jgi:hypothetical protein